MSDYIQNSGDLKITSGFIIHTKGFELYNNEGRIKSFHPLQNLNISELYITPGATVDEEGNPTYYNLMAVTKSDKAHVFLSQFESSKEASEQLKKCMDYFPS